MPARCKATLEVHGETRRCVRTSGHPQSSRVWGHGAETHVSRAYMWVDGAAGSNVITEE